MKTHGSGGRIRDEISNADPIKLAAQWLQSIERYMLATAEDTGNTNLKVTQ